MTAQTPTPPPVEPGRSTSEYQLTNGTGAVVVLAESGIAVAQAFGAHVTIDQVVALQGLVAALVALAVAYTVGRSVRKRGTPP